VIGCVPIGYRTLAGCGGYFERGRCLGSLAAGNGEHASPICCPDSGSPFRNVEADALRGSQCLIAQSRIGDSRCRDDPQELRCDFIGNETVMGKG